MRESTQKGGRGELKSLYKRQLAMMVGIVVLSFSLLASSFMLLSYYYIVSEKRESMENNATYIAAFTSAVYSISPSLGETYYYDYLSSLALISDSQIIIADKQGEIIYASNKTQGQTAISKTVVEETITRGSYVALGDLYGFFTGPQHVCALPFGTPNGNVPMIGGVVLVAADASAVPEMWRSTATIFFFAAVVVLLISIVASSLTSAYQTRPLKELSEAARKFGRGEFDVEITGHDDRQDEIGELVRAFNSMAHSLHKTETTRSEFIANVSHELKTPMTSIAGFAEGILDGTVPPERQKECLQIIVAETRRLSRLVRRMLDLSRLVGTEEGVTAQAQFDLLDTISQVIISLEGKITARNLDISPQFPKGSVTVWGDRDAVTQVCYNLLDNAAKFAASGTTITIRVIKKEGKVYTSFENLGATIPQDELPVLFDRFHKADSSRSVDKDGVGLGLYIVKTILASLKEDITAESVEGKTTFTFSLTLA